MTTEPISLSAEAMRVALWAALTWTLSFLAYMYGLTNPLLSMAALPLGVASVCVVGMAAGRLAFERALSFMRLWGLCLLSFLYGSLLTTLAQYVYFRFFDHGRFVDAVQTALEMPELRDLAAALPEETWQQALLVFQNPAATASNLLGMNISLSLLLSLPAALFALMLKRRAGKTQ